MGEGIKSLSELVKERLVEYNWQILECDAILMDYFVNEGGGSPHPPIGCFGGDPESDCFWCEIATGAISIAACILVIIFFPLAAEICIILLDFFHIAGSTFIACQIVNCC